MDGSKKNEMFERESELSPEERKIKCSSQVEFNPWRTQGLELEPALSPGLKTRVKILSSHLFGALPETTLAKIEQKARYPFESSTKLYKASV